MPHNTENMWEEAGGESVPGEIISIVDHLSKLDGLEYEQQRKAKADQLGVRTSALDKAVKEHRKEQGGDARGRALNLYEPEPWPEAVDGDDLLNSLVTALRRYLALGDGAAEAMALWVVHAHAIGATQISPRLAVTSPEKRCGKSTALSVLQQLVNKPLPAANITAAALFRAVEAVEPTLLIDEADTFLRDSDELRGILNSGHNKTSAFVIRVVGDDHEPRQFTTWAPVAIAMIGKLPDTLEDRAIPIQMRRKRPDEAVARFRPDQTDLLKDLASMAARWVADNTVALEKADPAMPSGLNDRAADNWRPLLAIADRAGGDWPELARTTAIKLTVANQDEGSAKILLLADFQKMFENRDRIWTVDALEILQAMEDRPWPEWSRGKPVSARQLARLLSGFGIKSKLVRIGPGDPKKGYEKTAFDDAFARYTPAQKVTELQPKETGAYSDNLSVTTENLVTHGNGLKAAKNNDCNLVTDENPQNRDEWEERAAVLEFEGGLSREDAERQSRQQCKQGVRT